MTSPAARELAKALAGGHEPYLCGQSDEGDDCACSLREHRARFAAEIQRAVQPLVDALEDCRRTLNQAWSIKSDRRQSIRMAADAIAGWSQPGPSPEARAIVERLEANTCPSCGETLRLVTDGSSHEMQVVHRKDCTEDADV